MINKPLYLWLLLSLQTIHVAFAQDSRCYEFYYKSINQAELSIVELNFKQAYEIYRKTFAEFDKQHRTDLYNASLCAILTDSTQKAKLWMKKLITLGFTLSRFDAKTFKRLPKKDWNEIKTQYDSLHNIYRDGLDLTYLAALDTLRSREQRLVRGIQSSYDSLLYVHAKILHYLITERGIPKGFEYGGQPLPPDVILHSFGLRNRLKYCRQSGIDTTIEPYKSMNLKVYDLESLLRDAIFRGELTPQFVAECMSYSELDSTKQFIPFLLDINFNTRKITHLEPKQNKLKLIATYRTSLGLESCQDAVKKDIRVALLYNQKKFPFDEFIQRFKEIGFTEKVTKSLRYDSQESKDLYYSSMRITIEIQNNVLRNDNYKIKNNIDNNPIYIENKWELLKQFRIDKGIVHIIINPL